MTRPAAHERHWSSQLMFLAAAIGSAVGISNVWKFTFVAGENGGGAFVLVYVAAVVTVALPALIAEFLVGRRGGASVVRSMELLHASDGIGRAWRWYGQLAALGAFIALSFYAVVAGWTIDYFVRSLVVGQRGLTVDGAAAALGALLADPGRMMLSQIAFLVLTGATVAAGVRRGLERALGWLTPSLFVILLLLLVYAAVAGDFGAGARFMFVPDVGRLNAQTVLVAVGQAFFSLGIGLGVLFTIGAYMDREASIVRAGIVVAAADVTVALLAGLAIFPLVFAHDLSPAEGPGLIFATLPVAFGQMPGGQLVGPLFFALMAIAALTSAITILETVVAAVEDYTGAGRVPIVAALVALLWLVGLGTVFSFNRLETFHPLAFLPAFETRNIFESLDYVVSNFMMPAGGVLIAVLAGWGLRRDAALGELQIADRWPFRVWRLLVRYLVPLAIAAVFLVNLQGGP
jgi:NSS family neurotransmitter:Na+ symporter